MLPWITIATLLILAAGQALASTNSSAQNERDGKAFSMFQVIRFPNDPCIGTNSRNGTCYTSSECTTKSGTAAGTCANGFGVCCTFVLACGSTSSQNCTYVENSGASAGTCKYKICKCNTNICQLRLDFISFVITGPSSRMTSVATKVTNPAGVGVSDATQCLTDTFTVSSSLSTVPVLCGTLTNDHIYVEANSDCNDLAFTMNPSSVTGTTTIPTRSWQIKVSQYSCDYANKAPIGCLQYFFNPIGTGTVRSFNWGGTPPYHLANQKQTICVRREAGQCRICWYAATAITDFQLSGKIAAGVGLIKQSSCCGYGTAGAGASGYDCVMVPGAENAAGAVKNPSFCGRYLTTQTGTIAKISVTVCSRQVPFQISFFSDNWEHKVTSDETAQTRAGFQLNYFQSATNC